MQIHYSNTKPICNKQVKCGQPFFCTSNPGVRLIRLSRMPLAWMRTPWYWHQDPHLIDFWGQNLSKSNSFDRPSPSTWGSCVHCTTKRNKVYRLGLWDKCYCLVLEVVPVGIYSRAEWNVKSRWNPVLSLSLLQFLTFLITCMFATLKFVFNKSLFTRRNIVLWIFSHYFGVWNEPPCSTFIPIITMPTTLAPSPPPPLEFPPVLTSHTCNSLTFFHIVSFFFAHMFDLEGNL